MYYASGGDSGRSRTNSFVLDTSNSGNLSSRSNSNSNVNLDDISDEDDDVFYNVNPMVTNGGGGGVRSPYSQEGKDRGVGGTGEEYSFPASLVTVTNDDIML